MAEKDPKKAEDPQAGTPAPIPQAGKPGLPSDTDQVVEQWFRDFIPNSPASRTTECYNHLYRAKEVLKARLKGE